MARRKIRRPAPGPASPRRASILRSTPSTSSPARSPRPDARRRFDARFLVVDARFIAMRVDGAVHSEAELVELVWTPLDERAKPRSARDHPRSARRPRPGARRRPRQAPPAPLLPRDQRKTAARAVVERGRQVAAASTRPAGPAAIVRRAPSARDDRPARSAASDCSAPSPRRAVRS